MIEKLICAVIIAALFLLAADALKDIYADAMRILGGLI